LEPNGGEHCNQSVGDAQPPTKAPSVRACAPA
jgi:hypothetical protein